MVMEALVRLPARFREKMENVDIVIGATPSPKTFRRGRANILGLYQGVPQTERTHLYGGVLPDKITLFQKNIERICRDNEEIKYQVARTVRHELAHHFGISDKRLDDLGAY